MGPWSFPIVAEARMAERLLEAERARLARAAAAGQGSRGSVRAGDPQRSRGTGRMSRRRRLATIGVTLVACLVLAGPVLVGRTETPAVAWAAASPSGTTMAPASAEGEAPGLATCPCGVPTFGWVHGPAAWLIDATLLQATVLPPVCPLP